jgi:hypothetical protein
MTMDAIVTAVDEQPVVAKVVPEIRKKNDV